MEMNSTSVTAEGLVIGLHPTSSREALRLCFQSCGITLSSDECQCSDHIEFFQRFIHREETKSFIFSLSHTKGLCVAVLAQSHLFESLGVDLERSDRIVSDTIIKKIEHDSDRTLQINPPPPYSNLEYWTLKEAFYKCHWPLKAKEKAAANATAPVEFFLKDVSLTKLAHSIQRRTNVLNRNLLNQKERPHYTLSVAFRGIDGHTSAFLTEI